MSGWMPVESLAQDIRFAWRTLRNSPGFALVAMLTLTLGIGANTAIFSVVDAVLVRGLPYADADRLMVLRERVGKDGIGSVAYPNYLDWRAWNHSFEDLASWSAFDFVLTGGNEAEPIAGEGVTPSYFSVLGVSAMLGRTFSASENEVPGRDAVALIGYGLWQRRYGSDPHMLGRTLRLNNSDYTVIGVLPNGFLGLSDASEVWIPLVMHDVAFPQTAALDFLHTRGNHWVKVIGRLKSGLPIESARSEMDAIGARLASAYPRENGQRGTWVWNARERMLGGFRTPLLVLLGSVGVVLLIACANVANLMLARSATRGREFAIRAALGAGRGRLVRQLVTEGLVLATAAATAGLVAARWGLRSLLFMLPLSFPPFVHVELDRRIWVFTALLSIGTGLVLGIVPALNDGRLRLNDSLKKNAATTTGGSWKGLSGLFVFCEVALTLVLLIGAALLLKSLDRMLRGPTGFEPDRLLTLKFYVPQRPFTADGRTRFGPELARFLETVPGVQSAAVTYIDPFIWGGIQRGFTIEGHAPISNEDADEIYYQECGPDYFRTMGVPVVAGREFTWRDDKNSPGVVIVSEAFTRRYWPGEVALGKRVKYGPQDSSQPWMQVIGIVGDLKFASLRQDPESGGVLYGPVLQSHMINGMSAIVRAQSDPANLMGRLREAVRNFDPQVPIANITTVEQRMRENAAQTRSYALLLGLFAALSLVLALVGVYGVISYWVAQRAREIGIRMALGARSGDVVRLVVGLSVKPIAGGVLAGLAGAYGVTGLMTSLLYHVNAADPSIFAVLGLALAIVAIAGCAVPMLRATRVDPISVLRAE